MKLVDECLEAKGYVRYGYIRAGHGEQLDRIEQMLKFIICRMPYVTFDVARPEDAPDVGNIFVRRK